MTYAVVHDIPASWDQYETIGLALRDPVPRGLVVHVAGPTDEGFRVIEVWATREDWERSRGRADDARTASTLAPSILRELDALATIHGDPQ